MRSRRLVLLTLVGLTTFTAVARTELPNMGTPEETFDAQRRAARERDWHSYFALESRSNNVHWAKGLLVTVCVKAFVRAGDAEAREILQRHKIDQSLARKVATIAVIVGEDDEAAMEKALEAMVDEARPDLVKLAATSFEYLLKHAEGDVAAFIDRVGDSEIRDVKVTGDRAVASRVYLEQGSERLEPMAFVRVDGSWFHTKVGTGNTSD